MLAAYLDLERPDAGGDAPLWTSRPNASKRTSDGRLTDAGLRQLLQVHRRAAHVATVTRTLAGGLVRCCYTAPALG